MTSPIEGRKPSGTHVPIEAQPQDNRGTENPSPGESPATAPSPDQLRSFRKKTSSGVGPRHPLFPAVNTATASRTALNRKQAMDSLGRLSQSTRSILDNLAGQNPPNRDAKKLLKDWSAVQEETDPEKRFQKLQAWMSRAHGLIVDTKSADADYRAALAHYQSAQSLCIKAALTSGRVKNFWGEKIFLGAPEAHQVELVRRSGRVGILEWTRAGAPTFRSADGQVVVKWSGGTSSAYLNGRLTRREYYKQGQKTSYFEQGSFVNGKLVNGSTGVQGKMKNGVGVVKVSNVFTGLDEESDRQVKREEFLQPDGSTVGEVYKYLDNGEVNVMRYAPDGKHWRTDFESSTLETGQIWAEINKKGGPDYAKIGKLKHEIVWVGGKAVKRAAVLDGSGNVLLWRVSRHDSIGAAVEATPSSKTPISVPLDGLAAIEDSSKRLKKAREIASALNKERGLVVDKTQKALEESLVKYLAQCAEFTNLEEGQSLSLDLTYLDKGAAAGQPVFVMRRTDKDGSFVTQIAVVSSVVSKGEHALAIRHPVSYDKDGNPLEKQPEGAGQFVKKWYGADGKEYHLEKFETQYDTLGNTYRLSGTHLIGTGAGPENVTVETVDSKSEQIGPGIIDRASRAYMDSLRAQGFAGEVQAAFLGGATEFIGDVGHAAAYVGGTAYHTGKSALLTWASSTVKPFSADLAAEYDFGAEVEGDKAPLVRSYVNWKHGDQADAYRIGRLRGSEKTSLEQQLASQRIKGVDAQAFRMDSLAQTEAYDRASRTPLFKNEAARQKALLGVLDRTGTAEELIDWGFEKGKEGQTGLQWAGIGLGVVDTLGKTSAETLPFVGGIGAFGKGIQWLGRAEQASQTLMGLARVGNVVSQTTHWLMQGDLAIGMARNLENVSVAAEEGDPTKVIIAGTQAAVTGVFVAAAAKGHAKQRAQRQTRTQTQARAQGTSKAAAEPALDPHKVLGVERGTPWDAVEGAYKNLKSKYRKIQRDNHPDKVDGKYHDKGPVPATEKAAAEKRFMGAQKKLNEAEKAYDALKADRAAGAGKAKAPTARPESAPRAPEAPRALPAAKAPAAAKAPKAAAKAPMARPQAEHHSGTRQVPGMANANGQSARSPQRTVLGPQYKPSNVIGHPLNDPANKNANPIEKLLHIQAEARVLARHSGQQKPGISMRIDHDASLNPTRVIIKVTNNAHPAQIKHLKETLGLDSSIQLESKTYNIAYPERTAPNWQSTPAKRNIPVTLHVEQPAAKLAFNVMSLNEKMYDQLSHHLKGRKTASLSVKEQHRIIRHLVEQNNWTLADVQKLIGTDGMKAVYGPSKSKTKSAPNIETRVEDGELWVQASKGHETVTVNGEPHPAGQWVALAEGDTVVINGKPHARIQGKLKPIELAPENASLLYPNKHGIYTGKLLDNGNGTQTKVAVRRALDAEQQALAIIQHSGITDFTPTLIGRPGPQQLIISRLPGQSLDRLSVEQRRTIPDAAWGRFEQNLKKLRDSGIHHNDISPANILWDGKTLYLIDFGRAKLGVRSNDDLHRTQKLREGIREGRRGFDLFPSADPLDAQSAVRVPYIDIPFVKPKTSRAPSTVKKAVGQ